MIWYAHFTLSSLTKPICPVNEWTILTFKHSWLKDTNLHMKSDFRSKNFIYRWHIFCREHICSYSFIWSITFIDQLVASESLVVIICITNKNYFLFKKKISLIHTNKPKQRSPNESIMRFSHGHHVIHSFHLMNHRIDCASIDSDALFSYWLVCKIVILCSKHIIRTYSTPYSSKCV